jgi:hypothetical protein
VCAPCAWQDAVPLLPHHAGDRAVSGVLVPAVSMCTAVAAALGRQLKSTWHAFITPPPPVLPRTPHRILPWNRLSRISNHLELIRPDPRLREVDEAQVRTMRQRARAHTHAVRGQRACLPMHRGTNHTRCAHM